MGLERKSFLFITSAITLGVVLADFLRSVGTALGNAVVSVFMDDSITSLFASFGIGTVEILYGPTVAAVVSLALAVALTRLLWRYFANPSY